MSRTASTRAATLPPISWHRAPSGTLRAGRRHRRGRRQAARPAGRRRQSVQTFLKVTLTGQGSAIVEGVGAGAHHGHRHGRPTSRNCTSSCTPPTARRPANQFVAIIADARNQFGDFVGGSEGSDTIDLADLSRRDQRRTAMRGDDNGSESSAQAAPTIIYIMRRRRQRHHRRRRRHERHRLVPACPPGRRARISRGRRHRAPTPASCSSRSPTAA